MERLSFRLTGTRPLLQHNERLANPLNEHKKKLEAHTKKRNKTEADHLELARVEFEGGMYFDDDLGPYVPGLMLERAILDSAKREKLGQQFKAYVMVAEDRMPLRPAAGKGWPKTIQGLWDAKFYDQRMVRVQQAKTLRTRPQFPVGWQVICPVQYDKTAVEEDQIIRCVQRAGAAIGIGDFRPRFGRFDVEVV